MTKHYHIKITVHKNDKPIKLSTITRLGEHLVKYSTTEGVYEIAHLED